MFLHLSTVVIDEVMVYIRAILSVNRMYMGSLLCMCCWCACGPPPSEGKLCYMCTCSAMYYSCTIHVHMHVHVPQHETPTFGIIRTHTHIHTHTHIQIMDHQFQKWMDWYGKSYGEYEITKGDFLDPEFAETLNSAT